MFLPSVALLDALFAGVAYFGYTVAPSRLTRRLCAALSIYCLIEMVFHVPMENLAGQVMQWIF
jgi:hypothetical protein